VDPVSTGNGTIKAYVILEDLAQNARRVLDHLRLILRGGSH
jgi:hypothetical protein